MAEEAHDPNITDATRSLTGSLYASEYAIRGLGHRGLTLTQMQPRPISDLAPHPIPLS
jgi:hypothetical protein